MTHSSGDKAITVAPSPLGVCSCLGGSSTAKKFGDHHFFLAVDVHLETSNPAKRIVPEFGTFAGCPAITLRLWPKSMLELQLILPLLFLFFGSIMPKSSVTNIELQNLSVQGLFQGD
jgi:hypothetical protein